MSIIEQLQKRGHICNLKGKKYVLFPGLIELAHENGLKSITNDIISIDMQAQTAVCQCTVIGERGTFVTHGDATPQNTGKMVASAFIRMAETRATARALRFYLGIGMTARDELPSNGNGADQEPEQPKEPITIQNFVKENAHIEDQPATEDNQRKIEILEQLLKIRPNSFIESIKDQLLKGRVLSDKQNSAVRKSLHINKLDDLCVFFGGKTSSEVSKRPTGWENLTPSDVQSKWGSY